LNKNRGMLETRSPTLMARDASTIGIVESAAGAEVEHLRLDQTDRRISEFVARMAHELRTPLGAILMWVHVLRMARDADRDAALDAIETSARSQSKIIEELLDVSRALTGRLRIERTTVDLGVVVQKAAAAMGQVAAARGVKLEIAIDSGEFQVEGDSARLGEMASHLVSNGIKFTPSGGSVEVRLTRSAGTARIVVRDTGRGIEPREIPGIFTAFRSGGDDERPPGGGLGLGLAFVRLLAELHHGVVSVNSEGPGRGSVFTVAIPLEVAIP
jgi:signal transduction histidine kinase